MSDLRSDRPDDPPIEPRRGWPSANGDHHAGPEHRPTDPDLTDLALAEPDPAGLDPVQLGLDDHDLDGRPAGGQSHDHDGGDGDGSDGGRTRPRRRRRGWWILLAVVVAVAATAGVLHWRGELKPLLREASYKIDPPPEAEVTATPRRGATGVRLDATVRVHATGGHLTRVRATAEDGTRLAGTRSRNGRSWHSTVPLEPATTYRVTWVAENPAEVATRGQATFTTLTPRATLEPETITPLDGGTYGIGQPLVVRFNHPVARKAAVEAALKVTNAKGGHGAWRWFGDQEVRYRPVEYWPAYSTVTLDVDVKGVNAGGGVWGVKGRRVSFKIGRRQVSVVNAETHQMSVEVDGRIVRTMPVSTGRPEYATRNGVHTILTKERVRIMDSDTIGLPGAYRVRAEYALRITNTGEFVHSAPWSVGAQGSANVSHGCVNLSPENAVWFFENSQLGDIVEVVGSTAEPEETEGMIEWNRSFAEWREGSALASRAGRTPSLRSPE